MSGIWIILGDTRVRADAQVSPADCHAVIRALANLYDVPSVCHGDPAQCGCDSFCCSDAPAVKP